ncbi:hypothetical protein [Actinomadura sp. 21ATH]|uniref:hypothetical protein n=1 Tax=Actinomadura sp. 21ATH TaxID=1735444 RepID=UPI0035C18073
MTGKTPKDVHEDAAEVDAVETEDASAEPAGAPAEGAARPARRRRRVRVIEVLDDEDLDEVLDAIDAEDDEAEEDEPAPAAKERSKAAVKAGSATATRSDVKAAPKPATATRPDIKAAPKPAAKPAPVSIDEAAGGGLFGMGRTQAIVVVVLVALLGSLAIWQWRTAAGLAGEEEERAAVSKIAREYGNVALNYNASNYQAQMKKAEGLMGGDLLESFKANTLPNLGKTFQDNPQLVLTSKTDQVFVGDVDERFAAATISVDVSVRTADGAHESPATLIRLAIAKIDGRWKVTKMYASGANDQNQAQQGGLPNVPSGSPSPSGEPKGEKTEKPKD